ncbi:hypothetical protein MMC32_007401 [Xylographa parallela]|nr:hypothetical protein [Xylographa parallela]
MEQSSAKLSAPSRSGQPQQPIPLKPNYDAFASLTTSRPSSQSTTPVPSLVQQQKYVPAPSQLSDPFAALSSSSNIPRQGSPFIQPQPSKAPSTSMFDFASSISQNANAATNPVPATLNTNGASADDDWNFSSALPEDGLPSSTSLIVSSKEVEISFDVSRRKTDDSIIDILATFSNKSANPITEYTFQVAVTKAYSLKLTPQSGRKLQPFQKNGITQPIEVHGVMKGESSNVKIRWKTSYKAAGDLRQEQGEVPPLLIA